MNGLPDVTANIIEIDPFDVDTVYLGTDAGVWRSTEAGGQCQWIVFSNGLPNAVVEDLVFHAKTGILRAATRSPGVWELDFSKEAARDVQVYLRHSAFDTGRGYPSLQGVADPSVPGGISNWWESTDILIDSEPYRTVSLAEVDFVAFEENRRADAKTAHGLTRVFVQIRKRGPVPATNVVVRLYTASVADNVMPDLPAGFWDKPDQVPAGSAWSLVGPSISLIGLQVRQPKVAVFHRTAPQTASGNVWLLAIVTADNDELKTT